MATKKAKEELKKIKEALKKTPLRRSAVSRESTKRIVKALEQTIKDKDTRKETIRVIKAIDLQKLRNKTI